MALANRFLAVKKTLKNDGEFVASHVLRLLSRCEMLLRVLGKQRAVNDLQTEDFETRPSATKGLGMESRSGLCVTSGPSSILPTKRD